MDFSSISSQGGSGSEFERDVSSVRPRIGSELAKT